MVNTSYLTALCWFLEHILLHDDFVRLARSRDRFLIRIKIAIICRLFELKALVSKLATLMLSFFGIFHLALKAPLCRIKSVISLQMGCVLLSYFSIIIFRLAH